MASLTINTGVVALDIYDTDGSCRGVFKFNPEDLVLAKNLLSLQKEFTDKRDEFEAKADACKSPEEQANVIIEITDYYKEKIDEVFGEGSSEILFGSAHSVGMFKDFFDGITPYFSKASEKRTSKYMG